MDVCRFPRIASITLVFVMNAAAARESVPVVYEDDNISIHAGVVEVGVQPLHLGDAMSLVVEVEFDAGRVQIENLDDGYFERAFANVAGVNLYQSASSSSQKLPGGRARVTGQWRLQILDCPEVATACPGSKSYELPVMALEYQIAGHGGSSADSRSARFRPWPGTLVLASALAVVPKAGIELTEALSGGGYEKPQPVADLAPYGSILFLAGIAFLATGLVMNRREHRVQPVPVRAHRADSRWEHAIERLHDDSLDDDQWSDLMRRSLAWYCTDELGSDPYAWVGAAAKRPDSNAVAAKDLLLEILQYDCVEKAERSDLLRRLKDLTQPARSGSEVQR